MPRPKPFAKIINHNKLGQALIIRLNTTTTIAMFQEPTAPNDEITLINIPTQTEQQAQTFFDIVTPKIFEDAITTAKADS